MGVHPIALRVTDDLRRSRLTVAFRLILSLPHIIWVSLWGFAALLATIVNWFATLIAGRSPEGLHRFLARYLRYATHQAAYLYLLANPFPGFLADDPYPVDLVVAPPELQNRWITGFRAILAIPAWIVGYLLNLLLQVLAIIAWFAGIFTARIPEGLRDLGLFCLRFQQQTYGYGAILTDRYPSFSYRQPDPAGEEAAPR